MNCSGMAVARRREGNSLERFPWTENGIQRVQRNKTTEAFPHGILLLQYGSSNRNVDGCFICQSRNFRGRIREGWSGWINCSYSIDSNIRGCWSIFTFFRQFPLSCIIEIVHFLKQKYIKKIPLTRNSPNDSKRIFRIILLSTNKCLLLSHLERIWVTEAFMVKKISPNKQLLLILSVTIILIIFKRLKYIILINWKLYKCKLR